MYRIYHGSDRDGSARASSDGRRRPCEPCGIGRGSEKRAPEWAIVYACDAVIVDCDLDEVNDMGRKRCLRIGIGNDDAYRERRASASQTIGDPVPEEWNVETC